MGDCDLSKEAVAGLTITRGRSLRREDARLLSLLRRSGVDRNDCHGSADQQRPVHALAKHPVRLSWRADPAAGWDNRIVLGIDLGPRPVARPVVVGAAGTRSEDIEVTFVFRGRLLGA